MSLGLTSDCVRRITTQRPPSNKKLLPAASTRMAEPNRSAFGKGVPVPSNVTCISSERAAAETLSIMHSERNRTIKGTKRHALAIYPSRFICRRWPFHLRSIIRQQFKLGQSAIELLHQRLNTFTGKRVHERTIVPKSALFTSVESRPESFSFLAIIHQDRTHIVQFVRSRHEFRRHRRVPNVSHIGFLSFQPRRLWRLVCIGTTLHDSRNVFTKLSLDIAQSFRAATIL